ncbi:hypothetical protein Pla175_44390 [Pirellulimonas nuda]|uniref:DUF5060 domain-containing protein n=1 Tax=Pirellulimonas nuda TaxID=2528009 RepID=A0A518DHZ3_9BACT|nr:DUF5060 domain-containing protein [Pirellulimonas nuda]QDU91022.1 hypothetical protein Pla175_44390 [Pirellulimonas nuda]
MNKKTSAALTLAWITLVSSTPIVHAAATVLVSGELTQWGPVTLTIDGPTASETDDDPNPFTDYALDVTFTHESGSPSYRVPGYFAADGNAAESSAVSGNKWRAHLSPDKTGLWNYKVSFLRGKHVAIGGEGAPIEGLDGLAGSFNIAPTDKQGRDLRAQGRLQYVGKHFQQFAGSKQYFLKFGADAPETLLAYVDFDNTQTRKPKRGPLKTWGPHVRDWRSGDPTWKDGKGKGLIGAINYLSGRGMNVFSFLTYNAGGDGDNVWPFVDRDDKLHYDCSKLDQWGIVFAHGQQQGMYLHFKLSEHENSGARDSDNVSMDAGELGPERKLYLRELIARYAQLLALNWNLGEENTQSVQQQRDMAAYIAQTDPYHHLIVTHTTGAWPGHLRTYGGLIGSQSELTGASIQTRDLMDTHRFVLHWVKQSEQAGKPWVVANDEQDLGSFGTPPDPGYGGYEQSQGPSIDDLRKYALWGTLMAGGAGVEYYFGYVHPQNDIVCEDWRSREKTWGYARAAHDFFSDQHIPFWEMHNANALVGNPEDQNTRYCLAKPDQLYLVYLPDGGSADLDLTGVNGAFTIKWFDPRGGGQLRVGSRQSAAGGSSVALGSPPSLVDQDWLVVVRRQ